MNSLIHPTRGRFVLAAASVIGAVLGLPAAAQYTEPSQSEPVSTPPTESEPATGSDRQLAWEGDFRLGQQPGEAGTPAPSPPTPGGADDAQALAKKLANPVAAMISVPFQFNFDQGYGPNEADRITLNIQPVIPFSISEHWNIITRTILPVIYQDSIAPGINSDFGLGDTTQSFFFSPKDPVGGWILGAGPVALWPTGTSPQFRSESLGFGPTFVGLRQDGGWTYGALMNHIWSVTNSDDHQQVNNTFLQPFVSYCWKSGTTLALNSESTYDWNQKQWTVPLNLMLSQLVTIGEQHVQFQVGGRYYAVTPDQGPKWGLRFTVTFLFPR